MMKPTFDPAALPAPPDAPYNVDDPASFDAWSGYQDAVADLISASSRWSAGPVDFRQIARAGAWSVLYESSMHWGTGGSVSTPPIENPTWLDLFAAADAAIRDSGDSHHIFIESFEPRDGVFALSTGS